MSTPDLRTRGARVAYAVNRVLVWLTPLWKALDIALGVVLLTLLIYGTGYVLGLW